jgi:hypothetical protein
MKSKTIFRLFIAIGIACFISDTAISQNVNVAGASVGNGLYPDLGSAFTAINGGSQTGSTIVISILGNTVEAATATLNQGTWNTLSILPAGGAARNISGNIAGPLVDFNGADRVLVDGLNNGGNSLTIDNSNNTAASTIRFINDAHVISVQNTTVLGANTSTVSGTIFFSTATTTGNDSITINACTIDASGANFPVNGIYSAGTVTVGMENSIVVINNCKIANFFSATTISSGALVATGNTDWTIQTNKFYQTASRTYTVANTHSAIQITSGNNYILSGNTIGFATAVGTGTYTMTGVIATRFIGINLAVGTTTASSVQGNVITAIALNTSSGASTANGILCGINITAGNVNVGTTTGNTIGATSGTNALVGVPTTTQGAVVGLNSSSTGIISIQNNTFGAFSSGGVTATVAGAVFGINISAGASTLTISGNTIGNTTADNMISGTNAFTTGSSLCAGINITTNVTSTGTITNNTIQNLASYGTGTTGYVRGVITPLTTSTTATYTVSNNIINNFKTNSTLTSLTSGNVCASGIQFFAAGGSTISGNIISNISALNAGTGNYIVAGITMAATAVTAGNNTVSKNVIFGLSNAGTGTAATAPPVVTGIAMRSGASNQYIIENNMISLGNGQTTNTTFIGIWSNHGSTPDPTLDNIRFNTVNIEGVAAAGALSSFCYTRGTLASSPNVPTSLLNNIFTNTRSGGTGIHYAIANNFGGAAGTG